MRLRATAILCLLSGLVSNAEPVVKSNASPASLVASRAGDLPILLSAPHGGGEAVPGVPPREGQGVSNFKPQTDSHTDQLAEELADAIAKTTGKRPYLVIARFQRKFIDANRPPGQAYESDAAKPVYDAYHQALATARREIIDRWGGGILLDIHGQATALNSIFRGTQNGKTTTHLVSRFGREALIGEKSLFGELARRGCNVIPPVDSLNAEDLYNGGHTVATYGSAEGGAFDAIQLELGTRLRSADERAKTVGKLTESITAFASNFLPKTENAAQAAAPRPLTKVRVGLYEDKGASPSVTPLTKALAKFDDVVLQKLTAADIRAGKLRDVDVLIHPGGSGGAQGRNLEEDGREKIRTFVRGGGGFVGICAGAYLASADYEWSLNILDAKVLDRAHWARGMGSVEINLSELGKKSLQSPSDSLRIHYAQGPLLAPANNPDIPDYETLATFKTEIALNGAPKGVMPGTTAAAQGQFGRGRVLCFSPHPEMTAGLENFVQRAIRLVNQGGATEGK